MDTTSKNFHIQKKTNIFSYILSFLILVIGVLGYFAIFNSYANSKICIVSSSFVWVSAFWFILIILLCFGVLSMRRHTNRRRWWLNGIYIFVVPFIALYVEEKIWNTAIKKISFSNFFLNYLLILLITIGLLFITTKSYLTYSTIGFLCWIYGIVNHYVLEFKGCPPLYNDLIASKTALTVMGQYSYWLSDSIICGTFVFLCLLICLMYFTPADIIMNIGKRKKRIVQCGSIFGLIVMLAIIFHINIQNIFGIGIYVWEPVESFYSNGAPITLLMSAQNVRMKKPKNYSDKYVEEILETYETEETVFSEEKPTVIVIMNESFADLDVFGEISSEEYLSNFYSIDPYVMRGYTYTSVWAGGTCNSEFEFLTGCSVFDINASVYPYQSWDLSKAFNLAELFSTCGYETVAIHPFIAENWNRVNVYNWFGFDKYISQADMSDIRVINWGASDEYNYEQIIHLYENRSKPQFIFNVTMQNHGGYGDALRNDIDLISVKEQYKEYKDVINYLTLIRESDKAFADLIEYFSKQDDPVVICMFGDHQPGLDNAFIASFGEYEEIADIEKQYMTPYIIWSNYSLNFGNVNKDMSINYLGANLLDALGMHTEYTDYLLDLEKQIPIVNQAAYQTADGEWHYTIEEDDRLNEYKVLQYYELFER